MHLLFLTLYVKLDSSWHLITDIKQPYILHLLHIKVWKWKAFQYYWLKKQIEPFLIESFNPLYDKEHVCHSDMIVIDLNEQLVKNRLV